MDCGLIHAMSDRRNVAQQYEAEVFSIAIERREYPTFDNSAKSPHPTTVKINGDGSGVETGDDNTEGSDPETVRLEKSTCGPEPIRETVQF